MRRRRQGARSAVRDAAASLCRAATDSSCGSLSGALQLQRCRRRVGKRVCVPDPVWIGRVRVYTSALYALFRLDSVTCTATCHLLCWHPSEPSLSGSSLVSSCTSAASDSLNTASKLYNRHKVADWCASLLLPQWTRQTAVKVTSFDEDHAVRHTS